MEVENVKTKDFKTKILIVITLFFSLVIICRLFYLQIFQYKTITQRAQYSTSKISILAAPRGIIYDRNKNILATNTQAISVVAYPEKLKTMQEKTKIYNELSNILKTNQEKLKKNIFRLPQDAALPVRLASNISIEEAIQITEKQYLLPGINIQEEPIRYYPHNSLASHILGYISQIDQKELNKRPDRKLGDIVGKYSIEKLFDDILRGADGKKIVEVDRLGKPINPNSTHSVINIDPIPGKDIVLTIDINLQKATEEALKKSNTN